MGNTLTVLRTGGLNLDLGLSSDADNRFGDTTARDRFLTSTFGKLWPVMARLVTEDIDIENGVMEYELEAIRDITRIDEFDSDGVRKGRITSWSLVVSEESDPPLLVLTLPALEAGIIVRAIGYAPYSIPTATQGSELPTSLEWIAVTGARAEAYRWKLNQYVDYEQQSVQNRTTQISAPEIRDLYLAAKTEFEQSRFDHRRAMAGPRRARLTVS